MLVYDTNDFGKGYTKALTDVTFLLETGSVKDMIKSRTQILDFLKIYTKKRKYALEAPLITSFKMDAKCKKLLDLTFHTEKKND